MKDLNGWTPIAKKVGIWSAAVLGAAGALTVVNAAGTWYVTRANTVALGDSLRVVKQELAQRIYAEGAVRDKIDSVIIGRLAVIEEASTRNFYTMRQIDIINDARDRRADSLMRVLVRNAIRGQTNRR